MLPLRPEYDPTVACFCQKRPGIFSSVDMIKALAKSYSQFLKPLKRITAVFLPKFELIWENLSLRRALIYLGSVKFNAVRRIIGEPGRFFSGVRTALK